MKIPTPPLALQVRFQWCALLFVLFVAAAPALNIHPLNLVDGTDQPLSTVSLSGTSWTGTLDPARLPAGVAQYAGDQSLTTPGSVSVAAGSIILSADGTAAFNGEVQLPAGVSVGDGAAVIDHYGNIQIVGRLSADNSDVVTDGSGNLTTNSVSAEYVSAVYFYSNQGLGVYGSNGPNSQPSPIADANDLESVIADFNALKADLVSYGLLAP